jgi:hypothetical protein
MPAIGLAHEEHRRAELENFLPQVLKAIAEYNPAEIQKSFEELVKLQPW